MLRLLACGSNSHGQLSLNSTDDVSAFTPCHFSSAASNSTITQLAFGGRHTIALATSAVSDSIEWRILVCGDNARGQIRPYDDIASLATFDLCSLPALLAELDGPARQSLPAHNWTPVRVCASWETSFVVLESEDGGSHTVLAFGANDWLERGVDGATASRVNSLSGTRGEFKEIKAGVQHVLVRYGDRFEGWGAARHGQLSYGETKRTTSPHEFQFKPGSVEAGLASGQCTIVSYDLGRTHTSFLVSDSSGHLTLAIYGSIKTSPSPPQSLDKYISIKLCDSVPTAGISLASSWSATHVLMDGRSLRSVGPLYPNAASLDETLDISAYEIDDMAAGSEHLLLLSTSTSTSTSTRRRGDGKVFARGWNEHGNLGIDTNDNCSELVEIQGLGGSVERVWAGNATSFVQVRMPE